MRKGIFFILMAIIMPGVVWAQEASQALSLKQAVEFALEHNKQLQSEGQNIDLYKQKVREAISQGLPQINGSVNYSTNFGYKADFGGASIKMQDQSNLGVSLEQLIFNGQWILGIQTSRIAERLKTQQVGVTELDIKENICNTYYAILVSERTRNILKQNMENMNQVYKHTDNMYKAGVSEITDVDQIRITVGQLKNSLLSMDRTIEVNYNLLRLQLGLQAGSNVVLTEPLESFLVPDKYLKLSLQAFEIGNNLEFQLAKTQEELNTKMVDLQKWTYAPTISGSYSYQYQIMKGGFMNIPHTASVNMSIPIFSGLQRRAQLRQAQITLEQTEINNSLLEDQLNVQNEQLKFELNNATENYNLQKDNIGVAHRVLENIQRKYEQGMVSSLDLTQANNNYLQAENNYTSACLNLLQAQTSLERLYNNLSY